MIAAVGPLQAKGEWGGIKRLYSVMMIVAPFCCGAIVVLVAGLYDRILIVWVGRVVEGVPSLLLLLLAGNTVAAVLTGPASSLCKGIGRPGIETVYVAVNLVLNLVLTIVLVLWIGPVGTVIASAAAWAASSLVFVVVLHAILDLPIRATYRARRRCLPLSQLPCSRG